MRVCVAQLGINSGRCQKADIVKASQDFHVRSPDHIYLSGSASTVYILHMHTTKMALSRAAWDPARESQI